jgi:Uncharacterised nucleotidyltransferase
MRPGMQSLLELLRGHFNPAIDEPEWGAVLTLAEEEHVLPSTAACLRSQHIPLTPRLQDRLKIIERDAAIAAFFWCSELKNVLRAFNQSQLRVVPLKGPFLAERLYGNAALRISRDLDLLVSKADLAKAEAVLTAIGFIPGAPDDYHRPWHRDTTTVELHHNVENPLAFNFKIENAIQQAHPANFQDQPCWLLNPEDELLFLCLHAARHRYEHLSLILDLQLAFEKLAGAANDWHPRSETTQLRDLLTLGLAMARRLQPEMTVPIQFRSLKKQHLKKLADRLWHRLLTQPSEPLDWSTVHAFYLEIELPGWSRLHRRIRHLQILAGRVIEPDRAFATRFGLHRNWQARMLRPLRILSERIRR